MPKFRKKPVVVEAEQWLPGHRVPGVCLGECRGTNRDLWGDAVAHVHTLEGVSYSLSPGDWVIRGVKGEYYPIKDDVFRETYEPAGAPDPRREAVDKLHTASTDAGRHEAAETLQQTTDPRLEGRIEALEWVGMNMCFDAEDKRKWRAEIARLKGEKKVNDVTPQRSLD